MLVEWDTAQIKDPTVITLGVFDGVHKGHQTILSLLSEMSLTSGLPGVVVTFDPHPLEIVGKIKVELLLDLNDRLSIIDQFPHSLNVLIKFDSKFAEKSPEDFVKELAEKFNIREIIIGYNFQFGKGRRGDIRFLEEAGKKYKFRVMAVPPVEYNGSSISSSRIRYTLKDGDINSANEMLGRPFYLKGRVIRGRGLGKEIGFPTANISVPQRLIIPKPGVYAVIGTVEEKKFMGVTNIGSAPTVRRESSITVETHFINFNQNIYDKLVKLDFIERIRPEIKFDSIDQLVLQIRRDIETAEEIIKRKVLT
jgi:riboflavin kinase/FMN adenylyltransferase